MELIDKIFKALSDPSRRELLDQLYINNGQSLNELCKHLDMSRQAVTKHITILEKATLITVIWHGREKLHYLNPVPLSDIYHRWIEKYETRQLEALHDLKMNLEEDNKNE